jgi:prevent-host-death family protein
MGVAWRLEEAKARFSEVVRRAREQGPQHVTVRGQPAAVILSADEYARLVPPEPTVSLYALFAEGPFGRLDSFDPDATRMVSPSRDLEQF